MKHQLKGETLEQTRTTRDFMAMAAIAPMIEYQLREKGIVDDRLVSLDAYSLADKMMAERARADERARSNTPIVDESYAAGTRLWRVPTGYMRVDGVCVTSDIEKAREWERSGREVSPA